MRSIETDNFFSSQLVSHTLLSGKRYSTVLPSLSIACVYFWQLKFKVAHIAVSVKTAVDVFSRVELKVTEKVHLVIWEDIQTTPIEVTTSSSDVADEAQFLLTQTDGEDEPEEQTLERSKKTRRKATEGVAKRKPSSMNPSNTEFTKIDGNSTSFPSHGFKANAQICRAEFLYSPEDF